MGRLNNLKKAIMPLPVKIWLGVWMVAVVVAAFACVRPDSNFNAPEAARIVLFHVPCAMIAVVAYVVSMVYAIIHLARQDVSADVKSAASASLGFLFTALATVTGMIFAAVEWGTAWNWDPREFSILMLLIVYAAYFALRGAINTSVVRGKVSAVYNILAGLIMPYLVFVLPRMMQSLHPERAQLDSAYRTVMFASMLGFLVLYIWMFRLHIRISELQMARRRKSVV